MSEQLIAAKEAAKRIFAGPASISQNCQTVSHTTLFRTRWRSRILLAKCRNPRPQSRRLWSRGGGATSPKTGLAIAAGSFATAKVRTAQPTCTATVNGTTRRLAAKTGLDIGPPVQPQSSSRGSAGRKHKWHGASSNNQTDSWRDSAMSLITSQPLI